jgi:limonene-1,2-epoxide hydrolase
MPDDPRAVVTRLQQAMNAHDLDAFVACFDPAYHSVQPVHPTRTFTGNEQVRTNWATFFAAVPDVHAALLNVAVDGPTVWSEWRWRGTRRDGSRLAMDGVIIMGIEGDRIVWARLYMEEVEQDSADITATMAHLTRRT